MTAPRPSTTQTEALFVQPPSPPNRNVLRDYAGGYGVALSSTRAVWGADEITQPSLALVYAFSAARKRFDSAFVDAQAEHLDRERLMEVVEGWRPSVIVAPVNLPSLYTDLEVLSALKSRTGAKIVAAGTVCSTIPADVFQGGTVDVAVSGDLEVVGERVVSALLAGAPLDAVPGITRLVGGEVIANPGGSLSDLDQLPIPAFDELPLDGYRTWEFGLRHHAGGKQFGGLPTYFPLYFSHGCPYGCQYCPYPIGFGRKWRRKSVDRVVEEFSAAAGAGIRNVLLRDQTIAEDLEYLNDVCVALTEADLGIRWLAEARLGSLPAPLLRLMHRAGCVRLHYGIETGDPDMFESEGKRGVGFDNIAGSLEQTYAAGILPSAHFLIGFPDETWASIERTASLIRELGIANGDCSLMTPYPGTQTYRTMAEEGRILANSWSDFTGEDPIVRLDHLSPMELSLGRWYVLQSIRANKDVTMRSRLRAAASALSTGSTQEHREMQQLIRQAMTRGMSAPGTTSTTGAGAHAEPSMVETGNLEAVTGGGAA
ncbi:MAG TPA: radical SAM protein [Coriobacteriia bacterium]|nr:radical SAM protein [Coriobacteriia bacterium]